MFFANWYFLKACQDDGLIRPPSSPRQPSRDRKKVRLSNPLEVDVANSVVHTEADLSVISVTRPFTKLTVVWVLFLGSTWKLPNLLPALCQVAKPEHA